MAAGKRVRVEVGLFLAAQEEEEIEVELNKTNRTGSAGRGRVRRGVEALSAGEREWSRSGDEVNALQRCIATGRREGEEGGADEEKENKGSERQALTKDEHGERRW